MVTSVLDLRRQRVGKARTVDPLATMHHSGTSTILLRLWRIPGGAEFPSKCNNCIVITACPKTVVRHHVDCATPPQVWEDERGFHMLAHGHFDENGALSTFAMAQHMAVRYTVAI
eukprot:COSAG02_NODE_19352_length_886_cov_0.984752_1_plen_115_part_00